MKKIKFYLSSLSYALLGVFMSVASARAVSLGEDAVPTLVPETGGMTLRGLLGNIVDVILIIVSIVAVLYLVWGGIQYVTAGGDADKASKGRVTITNAIIGIIIILAAFLIYRAAASAGLGNGADI